MRESDNVCVADGCRATFPTIDGIPILIDERFSLLRLTDFGTSGFRKQPQSRMQRLALRWLPTLDLNVAGKRNVERIDRELRSRAPRPLVLNIGGKHPKAALARLRSDPGVDCVEGDTVPGPAVDVVFDARRLPFADASFDAVFVDGVLEHCIEPAEVTKEIHRVLRPNGLVYADSPFMLPVHAGAFDFCRFSGVAHRRLFAAFRELDSGVSSGPAAALGQSIQSLLLSMARGRRSRFAAKTISRLTLFWIKYLDLLLARRPGARDAALGLYFLGERIDNAIDDRRIADTYVGITPDLYARPSNETATRS